MCKPPVAIIFTAFLVLVFLSASGYADTRLAVDTYDNGVVKQEIPFQDDQRHGLARWYNEKGELTEVVYYWMGQETELHLTKSGPGAIVEETPDGWRIVTVTEGTGTISSRRAIPPNKHFTLTHSTDPDSGEIVITLNRDGGLKVITRISQDGKLISREEVVPEDYEENISTTNWKTGETVTITRTQDGLMAIVKTDRCGRELSRQPWQSGDSKELHDFVGNLLKSETPEKWPDECDATIPLQKVIDEFNAWVDSELPGIDQPPITETEVIAVLISARSRYANMQDHLNYKGPDFDSFEMIAETRNLPAGSKFRVITGWESRPYTIAVWWVDLEMPNSRIRIRDRMIGVTAKRL